MSQTMFPTLPNVIAEWGKNPHYYYYYYLLFLNNELSLNLHRTAAARTIWKLENEALNITETKAENPHYQQG